PLVTDDDLVEMQAHLLLLDKHVEVHHYPGTGHWFAESGAGDHHDPEAAALAWERTLEFLAAHTGCAVHSGGRRGRPGRRRDLPGLIRVGVGAEDRLDERCGQAHRGQSRRLDRGRVVANSLPRVAVPRV